MQLHLAKDFLEWHEINRHENPTHPHEIVQVVQAEMLYYKNEDITVRVTFRIIERSNRDGQPFEVVRHSYAHVHQGHGQQVEFTNNVTVGEFKTLEDAQAAAVRYFAEHHKVKHDEA